VFANGYVRKCRTFAQYVRGRQDKDGQRAKEAKGKRASERTRELSGRDHSMTMVRIKQGQNGGGGEEHASVDAGRGANLWELL